MREEQSSCYREMAREYVRLGLCVKCYGKARALPGKTMCAECARKQSARSRAWRERMRAEGRCVQCGEPNDRAERARCTRCAASHTIESIDRRQKSRATGMCRECGVRPAVGYRCEECNRRHRVRAQRDCYERRQRVAECKHRQCRFSWRVVSLDPLRLRTEIVCHSCLWRQRRTITTNPIRLAAYLSWHGLVSIGAASATSHAA